MFLDKNFSRDGVFIVASRMSIVIICTFLENFRALKKEESRSFIVPSSWHYLVIIAVYQL
jgi:hypothetical protein